MTITLLFETTEVKENVTIENQNEEVIPANNCIFLRRSPPIEIHDI